MIMREEGKYKNGVEVGVPCGDLVGLYILMKVWIRLY